MADGSEGASRTHDHFDSTYQRHADPWGVETRWYEARKRSITLASLPRPRYSRVFEIGCSIGVLTEGLASRSDRLLSVDVSQAAVDRARDRLSGAPHVSIEKLDVNSGYPSGEFDLVVLSEVGYYLSAADLDRLFDRIDSSLSPDGTLILCHWRHPADDFALSGDDVHSATGRITRWIRTVSHVEKDFLLDVFSPDPRSVAEQTGLLK